MVDSIKGFAEVSQYTSDILIRLQQSVYDYAYKNTRGNSLKLNKQLCSTDVRKYFLAAGSLMLGIACL